MAAGIGDSSLFAFIQTVHARYAAAVIYFVGFGVDAGRLAVAGAKSAAVALRGVYDGFEEGVFGQETEHRTHWANRVAVGPPLHAKMNSTIKVIAAMMKVDRLFIHTSVS